ncbi:MAG: tetratricopeptide repeat protein [Bacteroidetes bacterium]|nr:tetratricopeptide repeat protein [Bacteroidota bacterium]
MDILKWYFKEMYDYSQLYLSNKQRKLLDTHFNEVDQGHDILPITSDYWKILYEEWEQMKNHVYENFLLRSREEYTHHYIALETKHNDKFCHDLKDNELHFSHDGFKDESSFDSVLREAFSNNCPSLIKLFASSGEGKTVFLGKIAYKYTKQNNPSFQVFYLKSINDQTVNILKDKILESPNPILVLLDMKPKYYSILNSQMVNIQEASMSKPFVMVIADQSDRYNYKLLNTSSDGFEDVFSEKYEIEFRLDHISREDILKKLTKVIETKPQIFDSNTIEEIFNGGNNRTIREQIYRVIRESNLKITTKHRYDWELFDVSIEKKELQKFKDLFKFVAIFSYFDLGVPISLFKRDHSDDRDYLDGLTQTDVLTLLRNNKDDNILHISDDDELFKLGKIELRHKDIAKWYFEEILHKNMGVNLFKAFLQNFKTHNDITGCYLFRNVHRLLARSFLRGAVTIQERKSILESFIDNVPKSDSNQEQLHKVMMELCQLEVDVDKKSKWLDRIISENDNDIHARTKKIGLLIAEAEDDNYSKARDVLEILIGKGKRDSYIYYYAKKLAQLEERDFDLADNLKDHPDRLSILHSLVNQEIKNKNIEQAEEILELITPEKENFKTWNYLANYYFFNWRRGHSKFILNRIINYNPSYVPASLLLHKIYLEEKNAMAETVLKNCIESNKPRVHIAPYVCLGKLYRSDLYKNVMGIDVSKKKLVLFFGEIKNMGLIKQSIQLSTEYAKWCFNSFTYNRSKHQEAISILEHIIENNPNAVHSKTELGLIYQQSKFFHDLNKSREVLEEAVYADKDKKEVAPRVVLARTYRELGDWDKAKELLEETEEISKHNLKENFSTYVELVFVYAYFHDEDNLNRVLELVLKDRERNTSIYVSISKYFLRIRRLDIALLIIENRLKKDNDNAILLKLKGRILLINALNENDLAIKNNLLHQASITLENNILKHDQLALRLQVDIYNSFILNKETQRKEYLDKVNLRNQKILELYKVEAANINLRIFLSKIFVDENRLRFAIECINLQEYDRLTPEDKLKILTQLKSVYRRFNEKKQIAWIDDEFQNISEQNKQEVSKMMVKDFERESFRPRDNYELSEIWNEGFINSDKTTVKCINMLYPIIKKAKARIHNQVEPNSKVYFATFLINRRQYANNIEPFFTRSESANLQHFLPTELNLSRNLYFKR